MGFAIGDVDNDGVYEIIATDMKPFKENPIWIPPLTGTGSMQSDDGIQFLSNTLYFKVDDNNYHYIDLGKERGVDATGWRWSVQFGDLDNDGFLDFYLGTGYPDYEALMPNVMYHNRAGKTFEDVTFSGGFGHLQKGHGIAFADLDGDGDQEVVTQMGGFYQSDDTIDLVFENPGFGNHWIQLKLVGTESNRAAIGARIHIVIDEDGEQRSIYKFVNSGGSFGAGPLRQLIGLGNASRIDRVEIYWPTSDQTQIFTDVPLDSAFEVTEGQPLLKK